MTHKRLMRNNDEPISKKTNPIQTQSVAQTPSAVIHFTKQTHLCSTACGLAVACGQATLGCNPFFQYKPNFGQPDHEKRNEPNNVGDLSLPKGESRQV
jgi:hypothetical protein